MKYFLSSLSPWTPAAQIANWQQPFPSAEQSFLIYGLFSLNSVMTEVEIHFNTSCFYSRRNPFPVVEMVPVFKPEDRSLYLSGLD